MLEDIFKTLILLFLLPIFPFSMGTNYFLGKFKGLMLLFVLSAIFFTGVILLDSFENTTLVFILSIAALLSTLFYALRLISVSHASEYLIFYYSTIAGFAWLWKSIDAPMFFLFVAFIIPIFGFGLLLSFLENQFNTGYFKAYKGLGGVMPRFSLLFILSIIALTVTPYIPALRLFVQNDVSFGLYYLFAIAITWLLISWSGISLIEKLIYGKVTRKLHYKDLPIFQSILILILYLFGLGLGFLFMGVHLG